jgi:hypothetical protein
MSKVMKKLTLVILATCYCILCCGQTGSVGIGTTNPIPEAVLQVHTGSDNTKGFLVTGLINNATLPTVPDLGAGSRLMFFPGKAAFRAGAVDLTQWNNINVGRYSTGLGFSVRATADHSVAIGIQNTASGVGSMAFGAGSIASGEYSASMGLQTNAVGSYSTTMGFNTNATGSYSAATGFNTLSTGNYATSMGSFNVASANYSSTMGYSNKANSIYSSVMGYTTVAKGFSSLVIGMNTDSMFEFNQSTVNTRTPLFIISNGWASLRQNALFVTKDGLVHLSSRNISAGLDSGAVLAFGREGSGVGIKGTSFPTNTSSFWTNSMNRLSIVESSVQVLSGSPPYIAPRKALEVRGNIRRETYSRPFSLPGNSANSYVWTHNLGYQPIIIISVDQTGGTNSEYVSFAYSHSDNNSLSISIANRNGAVATGTVRWIVVY